MTDIAKCAVCGEPMPPGEQMFKFHGYSGPCPKPAQTPSTARGDLKAAATALYMAGRWDCANLSGDEQARMWEALRDALGLSVGTATTAGVHSRHPAAPAGVSLADTSSTPRAAEAVSEEVWRVIDDAGGVMVKKDSNRAATQLVQAIGISAMTDTNEQHCKMLESLHKDLDIGDPRHSSIDAAITALSTTGRQFTPTGKPQECDTVEAAVTLAEHALWQDDEGVRWVPEAAYQRMVSEVERLETALSARASAGEGEPIGYVDPQRIHELKEGRLNIALFAERMGGNSLPLYAAAPQPAQAGASGGGEVACFRFRPKGEPHFSRWRDGPPPKFSADVEVECAYSRATPASPATRLDGATQCNACGGWNKPGCEPCCASPATGATLGVEGQMRLVAELANDMDEAHRAEQCTEFAKRLRAIFAPNWQTGAAHPQQAPAQEGERSCACPEHGNWINADDVNRLSREIDVAVNGEGNAAQQAALCDVTGQIKALAREHGPLYFAIKYPAATPPAHGDGEVWIDRTDLADIQSGRRCKAVVFAEAFDGDCIPLTTRPTPEAQEAREYRLFDSQWVNVVNHAGCYRDMNKEDAVAQAVKLTEQAMAANINDCKWPRPRKADAALALPAQGEGK